MGNKPDYVKEKHWRAFCEWCGVNGFGHPDLMNEFDADRLRGKWNYISEEVSEEVSEKKMQLKYILEKIPSQPQDQRSTTNLSPCLALQTVSACMTLLIVSVV